MNDQPGSSPDNVEVEAPIHPRAAFQHRDFRIFQMARLLAILGWLMMTTAIGYQIYSITGQAIDLGYVGLAFFLPNLIFALVSGQVADRYDRRLIILICQAVLFFSSVTLFFISISPHPHVRYIYATLVITGSANAFYGPASQALMPHLVPPIHFPNAVAWSSTIWQMSSMAGPALGGLIYARAGNAGAVYASDAICSVFAFILIFMVRTRTGRMEKAETSWQTLVAGIQYIWRRKIVLGAISMDLFAVLLGGATALLPIYARDILKVGETGFGFMRSAPAVGAAIIALVVAHRPPMKRAGGTMLWCVAGFGIATILFGISRNYFFSLFCLFVMGATDMVSVVIRHTLVQMLTPGAMRGRVSAVNLIFIGASNELGEFESGFTAHLFGTVPAVLIGGLGTLAVVGFWALAFPTLRKFGRLDQAHLQMEIEPSETRAALT
jgi:MFS family permease